MLMNAWIVKPTDYCSTVSTALTDGAVTWGMLAFPYEK